MLSGCVLQRKQLGKNRPFRFFLILSIFFFNCLLLPSISCAKDETSAVSLNADVLEYNPENKCYEASGDVEIARQGNRLTADKLTYHEADGAIEAQGKVLLRDSNGSRIEAEQANYNLSTGRGQIDSARLVYDGRFFVNGKKFEKVGDKEYRIEGSAFTSCPGDQPDWNFSARNLTVTLGGFAEGRNVFFHLKGIPVLYFPYLVYPVVNERQSGFLVPDLRYSSRHGVRIELPFYLVLGRHMDLTLLSDYRSETGWREEVEFRYLLASVGSGLVRGAYAHSLAHSPDTGYFFWRHLGQVAGGLRLSADVEYAEDSLYFNLYGDERADYNRDAVYSTVALQKNLNLLNGTLLGHWTEDLRDNGMDAVQHQPELDLQLIRARLGYLPVYLDVAANAVNWTKEQEGQRFLLHPALRMNLPFSGLFLQSQIDWHHFWYRWKDGSNSYQGGALSLESTLSSRWNRQYQWYGAKVESFQHQLEPIVSYFFAGDQAPDVDTFYDLHEETEYRNHLRFMLRQRLTGKLPVGMGRYRYQEWLRLDLFADVALAPRRSGQKDHLEYLSLDSLWQPVADSFLDIEANWSVERKELADFAVAVDVNSLSYVHYILDYRFSRDDLDYIGTEIDLDLTATVNISGRYRHNLEDDAVLEKQLSVMYRGKCWSLSVSLRERGKTSDRDEDRDIRFDFRLTGLGDSG